MSIVLKTIHMTLDPDSIANALAEVERFEKLLKPAMTHLIDRLAAKGVEVARAELLFLGESPIYRTGALSESIKYESEEGKASITAGEGLDTEYGSYAMFVEYGTGIVGANNKLPQAEDEGYSYDVHHHGDKGWWYIAPWGTYEADDGNKLAWTKGMAPRPFMHHTLLDLEAEAERNGARIIAEYIADHKR